MGPDKERLGNIIIEAAKRHLPWIKPRFVLPDHTLLDRSMEKLISGVDAIPYDWFIYYLFQEDAKMRPVGQDGFRAEGLIFNAEPSLTTQKSPIVKLYYNSGIGGDQVEALLEVLYPYKAKKGPDIFRLFRNKQDPLQNRAISSLSNSDRKDSLYYCAAEILCRTIAHEVSPEQMPLPLVLVDRDGLPVGFSLAHDMPVAEARDIESSDQLYNTLPRETGWYWFPPEVRDLAEKLEMANVPAWVESATDVYEQLLYDGQGDFVNFARIGYVFPDMPKVVLEG